MVSHDGAERIPAACSNCGAVYVARLLTDGTIRPIGNPKECECGSSDFTDLSDKITDDLPDANESATDD